MYQDQEELVERQPAYWSGLGTATVMIILIVGIVWLLFAPGETF